jgi:myo-inositol catabolism protein IolC
MNNKHLEEIYNEMPYQIKQSVDFPDAYIFLTNDQEQFIIELFENERQAVKETLLETIEEMKELVNEL